ELTAQTRMTQHEFLTPDRKVQRTIFGEGSNEVRVVINTSQNPYSYVSTGGSGILLPPYGFAVTSPTFIAFYAAIWAGVKFDPPALFTLRSLDNEPLERSKKIRVYHGFGSDQIWLGKTIRTVQTEAIF